MVYSISPVLTNVLHMKSKILVLSALILVYGKINAGNNPKESFFNHIYVGYSYTLSSITKSSGMLFFYSSPLSEVQFTNSRIFYGIQFPISPNYELRFTQYFKSVTFFDYTNSIQSNSVINVPYEYINRIVTDLEFGIVRKLKIKKTDLNIGVSYRWFFIGSEYSFTYHNFDGSIKTYNLNCNYDGASLSINYVNHRVELGCSFHLIPENHHNFNASISKVILIPELKGLYFL